MPQMLARQAFSIFFILLVASSSRCTLGLLQLQESQQQSKLRVSWKEVIIPPPSHVKHKCDENEDKKLCMGKRVKSGVSVVLLENVATNEECQELMTLVCSSHVNGNSKDEKIPMDKCGLIRIPTIPAFQRAAKTKTPCVTSLCEGANDICHNILQRVFCSIDDDRCQPLTSIRKALFDDDSKLQDLFIRNELHWSSREPAVNIYTEGGEFLAHKDSQSLTILLSLTCPETSFEGGGTSFWSQDARGHRVEEPSLILKPNIGTAILFGGCVTHAGRSIKSGIRGVLVASFSMKRDVGRPVEAERDIYGDSV